MLLRKKKICGKATWESYSLFSEFFLIFTTYISILEKHSSWMEMWEVRLCTFATHVMTAAVPEPQGERSSMAVWVSGLSQSSTPLLITTSDTACSNKWEWGAHSVGAVVAVLRGGGEDEDIRAGVVQRGVAHLHNSPNHTYGFHVNRPMRCECVNSVLKGVTFIVFISCA